MSLCSKFSMYLQTKMMYNNSLTQKKMHSHVIISKYPKLHRRQSSKTYKHVVIQVNMYACLSDKMNTVNAHFQVLHQDTLVIHYPPRLQQHTSKARNDNSH